METSWPIESVAVWPNLTLAWRSVPVQAIPVMSKARISAAIPTDRTVMGLL
jgi:hypothetical protein